MTGGRTRAAFGLDARARRHRDERNGGDDAMRFH